MPDTPAAIESRSLLGEALLKEGILTEEQLQRALRIQDKLEQPRQFGAVLIELGYATKQDIADALGKHGAGIRLGQILLEQGVITQDALEQALIIQRERGIRFGEALLELGAISERVLLQNLARQAGVPYIEPVFTMIEGSVLTGVSPNYLASNKFIPFSRSEEGTVTVVVNDLHDEGCLQAVRDLYQDGFQLALGPLDAISQAIEDFRHFRQEGPGERRRIEEGEDSVVQLVDHIIGNAIEQRASDIHIEPMSNVVRLRYRIDGVLVYRTDLPKDLLPRLTSRIKILAECNITEHQRHQGGRIFYTHQGREYDLRLSVYVTVHGECVVLRILNKQTGLVDLEELGMNKTMLDRFRLEVLDMPTGVVLITGPTGSGKTTTLYSSLNYCNSIDTKIITAEDPVEYMIDGLIQCSIYEKIGRSFQATLREIVRQDPDIIVLGEIRDRTSAETAIQAALTGHKVYSTFHTEDTIGGLLRLIDMDIETFLISSTVISVLAQRLLRRICEFCQAPYTPDPVELDRLGLRVEEVRDFEFRKGRGCKHCNYTGYHGRAGVYELLVLNEDVKEAILQKRPAHVIRQISTETTGLISMREDGIAKVVRGFTTFEEVLRQTPRTFEMRPLRQVLAATQ
ncbi:MAG: Flp pilus assembly complex ATPase component TadA [Candidatus Hydrogenedentes bacterium]|nr:Flp pilus assembly complex ATPase component TadA [Candidatus Hydrogenedentota bacterium]